MACEGLTKEFSEELTCPICLDYFTDPVITECGHNFCRACLTQSWGSGNASCPECRAPLQKNSLRPNRKLANMAEISKKVGLQEVKWSKGAGRVCERHQEPLKLFCREDEAPICLVCDRSKEHRQHRVIPVEEAADEYKEQVQAQLQSLREEKGKLVELKLAEEQRNQECLEQLEKEKPRITSIFKEMHKYLEEKEHAWLKELADLEKEIKERHKESMTRLCQEISRFSDLIKDIGVKFQQPPSEFLQDIKCALSRCEEEQPRENLDLAPGLEWQVRSFYLKSSALQRAMKEFEGSLKEGPRKVSVTLDHDTANHKLFISQDLKNVSWRTEDQDLPDHPERFNRMPCVLGLERFTSGRHCWEVGVEKRFSLQLRLRALFLTDFSVRRLWAVGVARESLAQKGSFIISPNDGVWAVGKDSSQGFLAFTSNGIARLAFRAQPRKIRVFLDYEGGIVEFFDAVTDNLIFAFPPAMFFGEGLKPFFWVDSMVSLEC